MPIHRKKDKYGYFYQWGTKGTKYYFNPLIMNSEMRAYSKAIRQMRAIYSSGYKE